MTDDGSDRDGSTGEQDAGGSLDAATENYKILGELDAPDGIGVLGRVTVASGATTGVEGRVDSPDGHGLATPDDARIEGAVDTNETDFVVEAGTQSTADARNVVMGHASNALFSGVVGATIAGGGFDDGSLDEANYVNGNWGTVGGGRGNSAGGDEATVSGGRNNQATSQQATVGGGGYNQVNNLGGTISGGSDNEISGNGYGGAIGGGEWNQVTGEKGTVGGGRNNDVEAKFGTIAGGGATDLSNTDTTQNTVLDKYGTIGGGGNNQAGSTDSDATTAQFATVGGGEGNTAAGKHATVGGGVKNEATADQSTIAGGSENTASGSQSLVGSGHQNRAKSLNATIGGGFDNVAIGTGSSITGGHGNRVFDQHSTVAGGQDNQAGSDDSGGSSATDPANQNTGNAEWATVGGGSNNVASGSWATVPGGRNGQAKDAGSFVWADSTAATFASDQAGTGSSPTGADTFHVRATGGLRFVTGLDANNDPNAGAYLSAGGSSWQAVSARAAKQNVDPVDPESVLEGVEDLEVSTWEYEANEGVRRMGPMAGEFHEAFDLGDDPETIGHVDADGVALAAIQGLAARLDDEVDRLDAENDDLRAENERLRERNRDLAERLAAVEERLGVDPAVDGHREDDGQ